MPDRRNTEPVLLPRADPIAAVRIASGPRHADGIFLRRPSTPYAPHPPIPRPLMSQAMWKIRHQPKSPETTLIRPKGQARSGPRRVNTGAAHRGHVRGRREYRRRPGSETTGWIPTVHLPRDLSMAGESFFHEPVPADEPSQWCRPSTPSPAGPGRTVPAGDVRKPDWGFPSPTGGSSGCGWYADARIGMVIPAACSHARQHAGRHGASAGSGHASFPIRIQETAQCSRIMRRSVLF